MRRIFGMNIKEEPNQESHKVPVIRDVFAEYTLLSELFLDPTLVASDGSVEYDGGDFRKGTFVMVRPQTAFMFRSERTSILGRPLRIMRYIHHSITHIVLSQQEMRNKGTTDVIVVAFVDDDGDLNTCSCPVWGVVPFIMDAAQAIHNKSVRLLGLGESSMFSIVDDLLGRMHTLQNSSDAQDDPALSILIYNVLEHLDALQGELTVRRMSSTTEPVPPS